MALGDEIGVLLKARVIAVLLGERPGLSASDSLGIYLTYEPRPGRQDAGRNCISNIRGGGLPPPIAARQLGWLVKALTAVATLACRRVFPGARASIATLIDSTIPVTIKCHITVIIAFETLDAG